MTSKVLLARSMPKMCICFLQAVCGTCSWHNLVLACWRCRSRILHGLMEHVNEVCHQTNLSNGVKHRGLSRFLGTQPNSTARRIPVTRRPWSFVVAVGKNAAAFQTRTYA